MHGSHVKHMLIRAGAGLLAALLCMGLVGAAGCGKKKDGAGAVVNFPVEAAPRRLDPAVAASAEELLVVGSCMEGLVRQDADGKLVPGVAEKWEISGDGRVLTFHLRGDNRWRLPDKAAGLLGPEGLAGFDAQVTAEDFVFGLGRGLPEGGFTARAAGRLTLELALERPGGQAFLYALAGEAAMPCRRAYFEACGGRYGLAPEYLPCNGPFYLDRMGEALTRLKPNEGYRDGAGALPAMVNLWTEPDPYLRARLVGADYDAAIVPSEMEEAAPEGVTGRALKNATLALVFNCEALTDVSVRVALCAALDPEALGIGQTGLLPGGTQAGGKSYRAAAGLPDGVKYDPARANALASSAALANSATEKIKLRLICAPEDETLLRRALQGWQRAFRLGLEAEIEALEPEELAERMADGDFDVAVAELRAERSSAPEALRALEGEGSPARYRSAVLETLLAAAAQSGDAARACLQAEEHLLQNGVYYPLRELSGRLLTAQGVEGLQVSPVGDRVRFDGVRKWE